MTRMVKFALLRRRADLDRDEFSRYWRDTHAGVLVAAGHREYNDGYLQNHLSAVPGLPGELPFDGIAEMTQAGDVGMSGFQDDPRYLPNVRPDELEFMDVAASMALFTTPEPVVTVSSGGEKIMALVSTDDTRAIDDATRRVRPAVASATHYRVVPGGSRGMRMGQDDNRAVTRVDVVLDWRLPSSGTVRDVASALDAVLKSSGSAAVLVATATEVVIY